LLRAAVVVDSVTRQTWFESHCHQYDSLVLSGRASSQNCFCVQKSSTLCVCVCVFAHPIHPAFKGIFLTLLV